MEGRDCISEDTYRELCTLLWKSKYRNGPSFAELMWNLMCRGISSNVQHFQNFSWHNDCIRIDLHCSKGNQDGSIAPYKHIFANPYIPECCFFVALGFLLIRSTHIRSSVDPSTLRLFVNEHEENTFSNELQKMLDGLIEEERVSRNVQTNIGNHSVKKGVMTYAGKWAGLSNIIAILARADTKLPGVLSQYMFPTGTEAYTFSAMYYM